MPLVHFARVTDRVDRWAVFLVATVILGLTLLSEPTLREFSSAVSVVCVAGLLWRIIGSVSHMTPLSLMLSVTLAANLASAALAQYLLSREALLLPPGAHMPDNTLGISFVLAARVFTLFVIVTWSRWLDERPT